MLNCVGVSLEKYDFLIYAILVLAVLVLVALLVLLVQVIIGKSKKNKLTLQTQKPVQSSSVATSLAQTSDKNVTFDATKHKLTFEQKYRELTKQKRNFYDDVKTYVLSKENCKFVLASARAQFKRGSKHVCNVVIKRGTPVCQFALPNSNISHFIKEENATNVKVSPVTIRLESAESVEQAKRTVDITIEYLQEEERRRKELRREQRRQKKF